MKQIMGPIKTDKLRKRAEKLLVSKPKIFKPKPEADLEKLVHELQVHQIELEMQNDELRKAQAEIEESRIKYADLYDFAPVGYFTFDQKGRVLDANLTGARLLGIERSRIIKTLFLSYLDRESQLLFISHIQNTLKAPVSQECELKIFRKNGNPFYASLKSLGHPDKDGSKRIHSTIVDITERKLAQNALMSSEEKCRYLSAQLLNAEEVERKRISYEIHDGVGQSLNTIKFRIESAIEELDGDVKKAREQLQALIPYVQENIGECRRLQQNLRPSLLDDLGILDTVEWFCREFQKTYPGIHIEKKIDLKEKDIPESLRAVIYRVFQESMNNIVRHSKASLVRLSLGRMNNTLELMIQDNGQGMVLEKPATRRGLGIVSMEERMALSGGAFKIDSTKGHGTTIRASWPAH